MTFTANIQTAIGYIISTYPQEKALSKLRVQEQHYLAEAIANELCEDSFAAWKLYENAILTITSKYH